MRTTPNTPTWLTDYRRAMPSLPPHAKLVLVGGAIETPERFDARQLVPHENAFGGETIHLQKGQPLVLEIQGAPSRRHNWTLQVSPGAPPTCQRFRYNHHPRATGGLLDLDRYTWTSQEISKMGAAFTLYFTSTAPRAESDIKLAVKVI